MMYLVEYQERWNEYGCARVPSIAMAAYRAGYKDMGRRIIRVTALANRETS